MALSRAASIKGETVQLFVKNNMQWAGRPFEAAEVVRFSEERGAGRFHSVVGPTGYLINLAAPEGPNRRRSVESLIQETELAESLGLPFLVLHPGSHPGHVEEAGLEHAAGGLDEVVAATRPSARATSAGRPSETGASPPAAWLGARLWAAFCRDGAAGGGSLLERPATLFQ